MLQFIYSYLLHGTSGALNCDIVTVKREDGDRGPERSVFSMDRVAAPCM
jgi:hypothetical protein